MPGTNYCSISISKKNCYKQNLDNGFPTNIIINKKGGAKEFRISGFPTEEKASSIYKKTTYL